MLGIKSLIIGIAIYPFRRLFKVKKNCWLFGADIGRKYSQNSKYLFEYVLKNHPEIEAYWITRSPEVYKYLKEQGLPVLNNESLKGAFYSSVAELKVMSSWFNDILYTFPYQKVAYLMHGIAAKKVYYDNIPKITLKPTFFDKLKQKLNDTFIYNYKLEYSCFSPVTSQFFKEKMVHAMRNDNVFVTGQPRTDAFLHLDAATIRAKYGIAEEKVVISYMPTHRSYGLGVPPPHVFINKPEAIEFFKTNNIVFIWKQHINMLKKYKEEPAEDCFKEMSFDFSVDPQELLYITDILITDWSSCFIDFMLLHKPILFYHYDDYEKDDNDIYFGANELSKVGKISKSEEELFSDIKHVLACGVDESTHGDWSFFNEFSDDKSCERSFDVLLKQLKQ